MSTSCKLLLLVLLGCIANSGSTAQTPVPFDTLDFYFKTENQLGTHYDAERERLYVTGATRVYRHADNVAVLNESTRYINEKFPPINGDILLTAPDGVGGIVIYGDFTKIGQFDRSGIAHLDSNLNVLSFDIQLEIGSPFYGIKKIHVKGDTLFIFGQMSSINNIPKRSFAAISLSTSEVLDISTNYEINNSTLSGGQPQDGLPFIDAANQGDLNPVIFSRYYTPTTNLFQLDFNDSIVSDENIVENDRFTYNLHSGNSNYLYQFNRDQYAPNAAWNAQPLEQYSSLQMQKVAPRINSSVDEVQVRNDRVLIQGPFTSVNGKIQMGHALLQEDDILSTINSPQFVAYSSEGSVDYDAVNFALGDNHLYSFTNGLGNESSIAQNYGSYYFELNNQNQGFNNYAIPTPNEKVNGVCADPLGGYITYGYFSNIGESKRYLIARYNENDELDLSFNLNIAQRSQNSVDRIDKLAISEDYIVFIGYYGTVLSTNFPTGLGSDDVLAIVNRSNGTVSYFPVEASVTHLKIVDNDLYVAGTFTSVNGLTRSKLFRMNLSSLSVDNFNAGNIWPSNTLIRDIEIVNDEVWVGGSFTQVNGMSRNNFVALNTLNGSVLSRTLQADGAIWCMAFDDDNTCYFGGNFTEINGVYCPYMCKYEMIENELSATLNTVGFNNSTYLSSRLINQINFNDDQILFTGSFISINGESSKFYAGIDKNSYELEITSPITEVLYDNDFIVPFNDVLNGLIVNPQSQRIFISSHNAFTGRKGASGMLMNLNNGAVLPIPQFNQSDIDNTSSAVITDSLLWMVASFDNEIEYNLLCFNLYELNWQFDKCILHDDENNPFPNLNLLTNLFPVYPQNEFIYMTYNARLYAINNLNPWDIIDFDQNIIVSGADESISIDFDSTDIYLPRGNHYIKINKTNHSYESKFFDIDFNFSGDLYFDQNGISIDVASFKNKLILSNANIASSSNEDVKFVEFKEESSTFEELESLNSISDSLSSLLTFKYDSNYILIHHYQGKLSLYDRAANSLAWTIDVPIEVRDVDIHYNSQTIYAVGKSLNDPSSRIRGYSINLSDGVLKNWEFLGSIGAIPDVLSIHRKDSEILLFESESSSGRDGELYICDPLVKTAAIGGLSVPVGFERVIDNIVHPGTLSSIFFFKEKVVLTGNFSEIGFSVPHFVSFDIENNRFDYWPKNALVQQGLFSNPRAIQGTHTVSEFKNNVLYLANKYPTSSTLPLGNIIRIPLSTLEVTSNVIPLNAPPTDMEIANSKIYISGGFDQNSPNQLNNKIGVFSATTLQQLASPFNFTTSSAITDLSFKGTNMIMSGTFSELNNNDYPGIVVFNSNNGNVMPWSPNLNDNALTSTFYNNYLLVGGEFSQVGIQGAGGFSAFELPNGTYSSFLQSAFWHMDRVEYLSIHGNYLIGVDPNPTPSPERTAIIDLTSEAKTDFYFESNANGAKFRWPTFSNGKNFIVLHETIPGTYPYTKAQIFEFATESFLDCEFDVSPIELVADDTNFCINDELEQEVMLQALVPSQIIGETAFGIAQASTGDILEWSFTGSINLTSKPAGQYLVFMAEFSDNIYRLNFENLNQEDKGCLDISNVIEITVQRVDGGTISTDADFPICSGTSAPVQFEVIDNTGPLNKWALLDQSFQSVLLSNNNGSFNVSTLSPGIYKVVHASYDNLNINQVDPQNVQGCINTSNVINLSIADCIQPSLSVYPNPANQQVKISLDGNLSKTILQGSLRLINMQGQIIQEIKVTVDSNVNQILEEIDVSQFSKGIYWVQFQTDGVILQEQLNIVR